jgi:murein L,D-transpeptidase YafK
VRCDSIINKFLKLDSVVTAVHRATLLGVLLILTHWAVHADGIDVTKAPIPRNFHLEFDKSERMLRVKTGGEVYREYVGASGSGGNGDKSFVGDKRTPEGIYRITEFNAQSKFHFFMRLNYPNVKDAFHGLRSGVISRTEFDRIIESQKRGRPPPQNTALGGAIGIHGVGHETDKKLRIHANLDWTNGCIALTNNEVSELRQFVSLGTEVVIKE